MRPLLSGAFVLLAAVGASSLPASPAGSETHGVPASRSTAIEVTGRFLTIDENPGVSPARRVSADVRPALAVSIAGQVDRPLWVTVDFEPSALGAACRVLLRLAPKHSAEASCAQDSILADTDYAVTLAVFADSALTDMLERFTTLLKFDAPSVRLHEQRLHIRRVAADAGKLPATFSGFQLEGRWRAKRGDLVVTEAGLEFITGSTRLEVPASWIRSVTAGGRVGIKRLTVSYDELGRRKELKFESPTSGRASISNLLGAFGIPEDDPALVEARVALERSRAGAKAAQDVATAPTAAEPSPGTVVTHAAPIRAGLTGAVGYSVAFLESAPDTSSDDLSSGIGAEFVLELGHFLYRRQAVSIRLGATPMLNSSAFFIVPITLNVAACAETQFWFTDRWFLAGGVGAGRYMTAGDAPRSGPVWSARFGDQRHLGSGRLNSITAGVMQCLYPGGAQTGFTLGLQIQWTRL